MNETAIKWAINLVFEEVKKRVTPETVQKILVAGVTALEAIVADFEAHAKTTQKPYDDMIAAAAKWLLATVKAAITP